MNNILFKTLIAFVPAGMVFSGSLILFIRRKKIGSFFQLIGSACLIMVILTHFCEALQLFPRMQWGLEHSAGHYFDLVCAVLGLTFFPAGYLINAIIQKQINKE